MEINKISLLTNDYLNKFLYMLPLPIAALARLYKQQIHVFYK